MVRIYIKLITLFGSNSVLIVSLAITSLKELPGTGVHIRLGTIILGFNIFSIAIVIFFVFSDNDTGFDHSLDFDLFLLGAEIVDLAAFVAGH